MRAVVVTIDDEPMGIIGVSREYGIGKYFSEYRDELRPYLKSMPVLRAIKASMEFVKNYQGPVLAVARDAEGARLMTRLGFTHMDGDVYSWLH